MLNRGETIAIVTGLAGAVLFHHWRKRARVVSANPNSAISVAGSDAILADLPDNAANLYYLTKPPWMIIPIKPFRPDNKDFPKPHRYRDPQGPLADIYNPLMRGN